MKQKLPLKTFEYSVVPSQIAMPKAKAKAKVKMKENYVPIHQLPLLSIRADFEKGVLQTEGDWQYMVASNKDAEKHWYSFHKGRIKVQASFCRGLMINLDDHSSDGMVFPFKGTIDDGDNVSSCSGLLVINNDDHIVNDQWSIVLYLYDYLFDSCEIIFKVPVYARSMNAELN
jgi:hypothetical protein